MKAGLLVDIQNDFIDGSLAVKGAGEIIKFANEYMEKNPMLYVATQDFHPPTHKSFASNNNRNVFDSILLNGVNQTMWPDHCVQGSWGAELHKDLNTNQVSTIIRKGTRPYIDSYSAFFDNNWVVDEQLVRGLPTGLEGYFKGLNIDELDVMGLATDYCVMYSVLDALSLGFKVNLILGGCRAVNIIPDDENKAIQKMIDAGAVIK